MFSTDKTTKGKTMRILFMSLTMLVGVFSTSNSALAAESLPLMLVVHDNRFEPEQLTLPTGVKLKLLIRNLDTNPIEFESFDLSREIIVPGHGEVTIYVGPLEPGSYQFFNDFNHEMRGSIMAKPETK
jgi:hypothetical protein